METKEITLLAGNNDKSNDNDSTIATIITIIRTEKGTIMGPNTAPANDRKGLELDKEKDKNKEEIPKPGKIQIISTRK